MLRIKGFFNIIRKHLFPLNIDSIRNIRFHRKYERKSSNALNFMHTGILQYERFFL